MEVWIVQAGGASEGLRGSLPSRLPESLVIRRKMALMLGDIRTVLPDIKAILRQRGPPASERLQHNPPHRAERFALPLTRAAGDYDFERDSAPGSRKAGPAPAHRPLPWACVALSAGCNGGHKGAAKAKPDHRQNLRADPAGIRPWRRALLPVGLSLTGALRRSRRLSRSRGTRRTHLSGRRGGDRAHQQRDYSGPQHPCPNQHDTPNDSANVLSHVEINMQAV